MAKFQYNPQSSEDQVTSIFGQTVEAGESVEVTDEAQIAKLQNHPEFAPEKERKAAAEKTAKQEQKTAKLLEDSQKAASEARAKADAASGEYAARQRALAQVEGIAEANAPDPNSLPNESQ